MRVIGGRLAVLRGSAMIMMLLVVLDLPARGAAREQERPSERDHQRTGCGRVRPLDGTAALRLAVLSESSRTAADALRLLCAHPHVWLTITSNGTLLHNDGSRGLSRFWIDAGMLIGSLQFDTGDSHAREQTRALAHELAHALEFSLLPPQADTEALASALLPRLGRHAPWWRYARIETPFAIALERAIMREVGRGRLSKTSALRRIALDHGLPVRELPAQATTRHDTSVALEVEAYGGGFHRSRCHGTAHGAQSRSCGDAPRRLEPLR